jgi:hypothetical protein
LGLAVITSPTRTWLDVVVLLQGAAQVAVGEDSEAACPAGSTIAGHADALLRHLDDRVGQQVAGAAARQLLALAHDVAHVHQQPPAEGARGMVHREVVALEAARVEERHRERIAQGERRRGARGGREVERAASFSTAASRCTSASTASVDSTGR